MSNGEALSPMTAMPAIVRSHTWFLTFQLGIDWDMKTSRLLLAGYAVVPGVPTLG